MKFSKELKAGLIAILAIVGFVILFQFMKGKSLFSTDHSYYAKFDNVEGLEVSSPLSINGLKVGQVDKILAERTKQGKLYFVVKLIADSDFNFSKNSTVEVFEPGLMSGKQARINIVYDGAPMAKDGDTLKGAYQMSMMNNISSQIGPVKDQAQIVLKRIDSLMINANAITDASNQAQIRALLGSLNRTVSSLETTSRGANNLLANNDPRIQKMLDNANLATISAKSAIDKYGHVAERVDVDKLNATIDNLNKTSAQLHSVVSGIQNGEGSIGKLAKDEELYQNLNRTSRHLDSLIIDVKAHPKRYVNFSVFGKNTDK